MPLNGRLLHSSLKLVSGSEERLTTRFYDVLFEHHPKVRPLFGHDVQEHATMLQESIVAVLDTSTRPTGSKSISTRSAPAVDQFDVVRFGSL